MSLPKTIHESGYVEDMSFVTKFNAAYLVTPSNTLRCFPQCNGVETQSLFYCESIFGGCEKEEEFLAEFASNGDKSRIKTMYEMFKKGATSLDRVLEWLEEEFGEGISVCFSRKFPELMERLHASHSVGHVNTPFCGCKVVVSVSTTKFRDLEDAKKATVYGNLVSDTTGICVMVNQGEIVVTEDQSCYNYVIASEKTWLLSAKYSKKDVFRYHVICLDKYGDVVSRIKSTPFRFESVRVRRRGISRFVPSIKKRGGEGDFSGMVSPYIREMIEYHTQTNTISLLDGVLYKYLNAKPKVMDTKSKRTPVVADDLVNKMLCVSDYDDTVFIVVLDFTRSVPRVLSRNAVAKRYWSKTDATVYFGGRNMNDLLLPYCMVSVLFDYPGKHIKREFKVLCRDDKPRLCRMDFMVDHESYLLEICGVVVEMGSE